MNICLTPELEEFINQKLANGMYHTASEVVRDALQLLQIHDQVRERHREELRKEIALGLEQLERGECSPFNAEEIKAEGRRILQERYHT